MSRRSSAALEPGLGEHSARVGNSRKRTLMLLLSTALSAAVVLACSLSAPAAGPVLGTALSSAATAAGTAISAAATAAATDLPQPTPVPARPTDTPAPTDSLTPALEAACNGAPARFSPDGQWVLCDLKDADNKSLAFVAGANGKHWDVNYPKLAGPVPIYDDSIPLVWTLDDRYVYAAVVERMAAGDSRAFGNTGDLWRMDLTSGAVQDLFPTGEAPFETWVYDQSLSPDGRHIALVNQYMTPLDLIILNLPGDSKTTIKLADNPENDPTWSSAGELFWTPDGNSIVYKYVVEVKGRGCSYDYSILILNLQNRATQTIVPSTHVALCSGVPTEYHVTQVSNTQVALELNGVTWVYDLDAGVLSPQGTLTPTP